MTKTTTAAMSGASLKTQLGGLGIPPSWFADKMGVTMRTVVRWFDGDNVAPKVVDCVNELHDTTLAEMRKMVRAAEKDLKARGDGRTILRTYRVDDGNLLNGMPASWHRALTFRVMEHFRARGDTVMVMYQ